MSLGVPVVDTAVEGLHGVLADGRGVLAAADDSAALARAIDWPGRASRSTRHGGGAPVAAQAPTDHR
jgi:glycosyltransferase involved in cell wall biosynthesis